MRENALDHRGLFDHSDVLELAATHATLNIKVVHPLEQARPTHARRRAMRSLEAIAADLRNGKVSRAAAERDYGVERVRAALNS